MTHRHEPHRRFRVLLVHKLFGASRGLSHIGLGVAAISTQKTLRAAGILCNILAIGSAHELASHLEANPHDSVIISAPWIATHEIARVSHKFPETQFAVCCHSNIGFLQADTNGVKLIRELIDLESCSHNVFLAGNTKRFCDWIHAAFARPCKFLPNLYYLDEHSSHPIHSHPIGHSGPLRIGMFGATRPLKNLMTGAAAAVEIGRSMRFPLQLWLSGGRAEGGGQSILTAVQEMLAGLPNVELKHNSWQTWQQFRRTIGHMHLLLQPSYTESFNMVTADGVAEGVPSVVSEAIDWAPEHWKADVDNANSIARIGRHLLNDAHAAREGLNALKSYVSAGLRSYQSFFDVG
jgi:hypothetical protein